MRGYAVAMACCEGLLGVDKDVGLTVELEDVGEDCVGTSKESSNDPWMKGAMSTRPFR